MSNNGRISIQSRGFLLTGNEVDELARLCRENDIEFENTLLHMDSVQASAFWSWVTVYLSDDTINALVTGTISTVIGNLIAKGLAEVIKSAWNKFVRGGKNGVIGQNDKSMTAIELKSSSANLEITSDKATTETLSDAIKSWEKVSKDTASKDGQPVIPTFVVIDGDIKIMSQNEYVTQYIILKRDEAEDKTDGQA